ncbi:hypothetical protein [Polyangium sorediatum]|uniref:DUF2251 domain-containing protein n=1 Tax=Polyangium sorediatum TaxID=889274 RepID=A0ABT6NWT8_9BACT|nr:hypothetical protein [Polyangium sorediatum]MDI1432822.1 hypothetical protein [Polyangium sorediatum]
MDDSTKSNEVLLRFDHPDGSLAVVLDDDNRVAYAYLLEDEEVVGDVWLYNVMEAPDTVNWEDSSPMPFLNPRDYCKSEKVRRLTPQSAVQCAWFDAGVEVSIDGIRWARIERGSKPGWSRLAAQPGPLAIPLEARMPSR